MFQCPDCGARWGGHEHEHRCPPATTGTGTAPMEVPWRWTPYVPAPITTDGTYNARCTCSRKGMTLPEVIICPIHDVTTILYTGNA